MAIYVARVVGRRKCSAIRKDFRGVEGEVLLTADDAASVLFRGFFYVHLGVAGQAQAYALRSLSLRLLWRSESQGGGEGLPAGSIEKVEAARGGLMQGLREMGTDTHTNMTQ